MSKGIDFIIPLLFLVVTITPTIAHATNSLTSFSEKSAAYNAGFSQGFVGVRADE
jgi:hypothetical protein